MDIARRGRAPDFAEELARCDELESTFAEDPYWETFCDEWADSVLEKIRAWNPRFARTFLVVSVFESSKGVYMPDEVSIASQKLLELRQRRCRLEVILVRQRRFGWITGLLHP